MEGRQREDGHTYLAVPFLKKAKPGEENGQSQASGSLFFLSILDHEDQPSATGTLVSGPATGGQGEALGAPLLIPCFPWVLDSHPP